MTSLGRQSYTSDNLHQQRSNLTPRLQPPKATALAPAEDRLMSAVAHRQRRHRTANSIYPVSRHSSAWRCPNYHQTGVCLSLRQAPLPDQQSLMTQVARYIQTVSLQALGPPWGGHLAGVLRTIWIAQTYLERHRTLCMLGIWFCLRLFVSRTLPV